MLVVAMLAVVLPTPSGAEMFTLFTTPAERQIINANRYKSDEVKSRPVAEPEALVKPAEQKTVSQQYKVSGITLSSDGAHSVWINDAVFENGEMLADKSKINIIHEGDIRVRITAPDGKHYFATSGETIEITYLEAVQNQ
ncbi:MAG: hypothetical protein ACI822_003043 [Gammaproteobacteria bacterium]|jgi:hypothetical protein